MPRPQYVELASGLANFNADPEPDGWRAEVVLRDSQDQPVTTEAMATFELMPRVPPYDLRSIDHHRASDPSQSLDARAFPIRWSLPLHFDADGVARLKLRLRPGVRELLGWDSPSGASSPYGDSAGRRLGASSGPRVWKPGRTFVTVNTNYLIAMPSLGVLRLRVTVPNAGVLETAAAVQIRPSVLVDTQWPYR